MRLRRGLWGIAVQLGVATAVVPIPALAFDGGNGSKNFRVPGSVPNYFSNESGPMIGGAAESRRGQLYTAGPVAAAPRATAIIAPAPPARQHVAMVEPRGRAVVHAGRHTSSRAVHRAAGRERTPRHVAVRGGGHPRSVHAAHASAHSARAGHTAHAGARAAAHTSGRTTHTVTSRRHGRG
jgi:hypothetical protein